MDTLEPYKGDELVWSNLAECTANEDGQLSFGILYGGADGAEWCAGKFYLDESRSQGNDYYIEGAFIPAGAYRESDGPLRLQIGLRVSDPERYSVLDGPAYIAVKMKDGETLVVQDRENRIGRTLYALGQTSGPDSTGYDAGTYVLARTFDLENVRAVVLNDAEYPLSD